MKRNVFHLLHPATLILRIFFMATALLALYGTFSQAAEGHGGRLNLVTAIEQVAKQNIPAVVHIEVTERKEVDNPLLPFEKDPFFRRYFNLPKKMPKKFKQEIVGLGKRRHYRHQGPHSHQQPFGCGSEQDSGGNGQRAISFRELGDAGGNRCQDRSRRNPDCRDGFSAARHLWRFR